MRTLKEKYALSLKKLNSIVKDYDLINQAYRETPNPNPDLLSKLLSLDNKSGFGKK